MKVLKRTKKGNVSQLEEFDLNKIINAVKKAYISQGKEPDEEVLKELTYIPSYHAGASTVGVETIQKEVEKILMDLAPYDVARAYIIYREQHKQARFIRERIDYMNEYSQSNSNAATSSETDGNSNVSIKNVANLEGEVYKTTNRIIQRQRMKDKLKQMFPEVAEQYEKDINHHIIYIHDEASTPVLKNYCMAVSLYPLMEHGTSTMDGLLASTPKNIDSFCGQFVNLVFLLSSQCKGAVGFGEFFNFFDYYCAKEWGDNYYLKEDVIIDADSKINKKTVGQKIEQYFQQIVYSMNQPAGNRSYQSPFTNFNYFDSNYWHSLFDDFVFPDGSKPVWERVSYLQKKFIRWFNKERTKTLLTYPVESMCLLHNGKDVLDKEYKEFAAEMWSEGHSFFMYLSDNPDAVASCCRLRNEVKNNTFSSTTGLTGVQTGSANVITLNLNRIIQDCDRYYNGELHSDEDGNPSKHWKGQVLWKCTFYPLLKEYLIDILERVYKYHVAYKTMLYELEEQGMLTASKAGYISMRKLFSTIGVNGFNEAAEFLGMEISNNEKYKEFISFLFKTILDFCKEKSTPQFLFNLEVVPAESLGSKNYNWDKEDGYNVPSDRVLYNSYIYDAHNPNISVLDRFILQGGEIAKSCSGGQAVHCNLEDHLSKEQYLKLIDFAIAEGTNYFTFNIPNSQCDDCGFITKHPIKECPKCHSKNITQWTRTIGYLRPIKSFDYYRQIEANKRVYSNGKDEIKC